jgi:hypothetical protein
MRVVFIKEPGCDCVGIDKHARESVANDDFVVLEDGSLIAKCVNGIET